MAIISLKVLRQYHQAMKKPTRNYRENFNLRLPDGMRDAIKTSGAERDLSMNDEFIRRLKLSFQVPDDVARACADMGGVKDRLDFAVRLFKEAGIEVFIPKKKKP